MKILVLSFYYRPDLCAGSFRTTALVESLRERMPPGATIDVVTTLPNRYSSFTADAPELEHDGAVTISRIALPAHQSGMLDQSRAFVTFARAARERAGTTRYDIVFATSSRLMTAALGATIARRVGAPLYLDIRDIFVDTIAEVAARPIAWSLSPFFSSIERWTVGTARKVNLVSRGFAEYFGTRYPRQRFSYFTNGIDDEFAGSAGSPAQGGERAAGAPLTVLYAGNLGEGQGLHAILPPLARRLAGRVHFQVIGDGGRKRALEQALAEAGVTNVELRPPVPRPRLLELYRAADVLFLHLNDYDAFRKVLPSKIFEYGALGKPVWAGVAGHAAEFIRAELDNAAVFPPCDADAAVRALDSLAISDTPRSAFVAKYARAAISRDMADDILAVAREGR